MKAPKKFKRVFISHPIAGNVESNLNDVRWIIRQIALYNPTIIPVAPYMSLLQCLDDTQPNERKIGLNLCLLELSTCNELWVFGKQPAIKASKGVQAEIRQAKKLNIPILYANKFQLENYID